nr:iron ABC transporter permease [Synergistaceae bacterium]
FMVYLSQHNGAESAMFWMLGGLGGARWGRLGVPFAIVILALIIFMLNARNLNALLLGDESAAAIGVDIVKFRRFLFVASSVLTGVIVAVSGSIGFVGLIVPHAVRLIAGADHERVLPIGALAGAIFLIWADLFSRTVLAPRELPLGIITGFVGAPFFIWLLTRNKH